MTKKKPTQTQRPTPARARAARSICAIVAVGLCALSATTALAAQVTARPGLFGSTEVPHTGLKPFPKWTGALERYFAEQKQRKGECTQTTFNKCHWKIWELLLKTTRDQPRKKQLNLVNTFMNKYRYIVDPINWGVLDYWASPAQFFKKYGDCEDYSIAKYLSLRALGWDPKDMRIIVLQDLNLKVAHAVLAVKMDGKEYILDNQISLVIEAKRIRHYRPIFSVNEFGWWRHLPANRTATTGRRVIRISSKKKTATNPQ